jgi:hypothetical protein
MPQSQPSGFSTRIGAARAKQFRTFQDFADKLKNVADRPAFHRGPLPTLFLPRLPPTASTTTLSDQAPVSVSPDGIVASIPLRRAISGKSGWSFGAFACSAPSIMDMTLIAREKKLNASADSMMTSG